MTLSVVERASQPLRERRSRRACPELVEGTCGLLVPGIIRRTNSSQRSLFHEYVVRESAFSTIHPTHHTKKHLS
jgi:hypothetical protein